MLDVDTAYVCGIMYVSGWPIIIPHTFGKDLLCAMSVKTNVLTAVNRPD